MVVKYEFNVADYVDDAIANFIRYHKNKIQVSRTELGYKVTYGRGKAQKKERITYSLVPYHETQFRIGYEEGEFRTQSQLFKLKFVWRKLSRKELKQRKRYE